MREEILWLAKTLTGAQEQDTLLLPLCAAACEQLRCRLKQPEEIDSAVFSCAAAYLAAASYFSGSAAGAPYAWSAGDVSVHEKGAEETARTAALLRREAERMMAPYLSDDAFAFRGMRG